MTRTWLLVLGVVATVGFAIIVLVVLPRVVLTRVGAPEALRPYSPTELHGRQVYVANGCVYCHSQQIRDTAFTTDVQRGWGGRPTVPADYVYDQPHLLGTMRTGPDLINVGQRLPDPNWHLAHLYDPRAVVPWSIMPAFKFLFEEKAPDAVQPGDRVVPVSGTRAPAGKAVVATADALALVDYLLSLRRGYPVSASAGGTGSESGHERPAAGPQPGAATNP